LDWQQLQLIITVGDVIHSELDGHAGGHFCGMQTLMQVQRIASLPDMLRMMWAAEIPLHLCAGCSISSRVADRLCRTQNRTYDTTPQAGGWACAGTAVLQAGPGGCLMPARYETYDALVVQVEGARRVLLVSPDMVRAKPCAQSARLALGCSECITASRERSAKRMGLCSCSFGEGKQRAPGGSSQNHGRKPYVGWLPVDDHHRRHPPPVPTSQTHAHPQAFRGATPFPVAHPYDGYSCLDFEDPEVEHWPRAKEVRVTSPPRLPGVFLIAEGQHQQHS
jgi:hypothetical protein